MKDKKRKELLEWKYHKALQLKQYDRAKVYLKLLKELEEKEE